MSESALYNKIGFKYNETRCADRYLTKCFQNFLNPQENENYLDAGCGTGNYTRALSSDKYQFYGIDPSDLMLGKARQPKSRVIWQKSDAENLPFENEFFGGAIASLTIHHWKDLHQAFGEINRVLKPHGKFVLFTAFPEQMENYWLNHYFPQMMRDSTKQMPAFSAVKESLKNAGFEITKKEKVILYAMICKIIFSTVAKTDPNYICKRTFKKESPHFQILPIKPKSKTVCAVWLKILKRTKFLK